MPSVGESKTNRITGQRAVFDGQQWRAIIGSQGGAAAGGGSPQFNRTLDQKAANDVRDSRQNASGALSRISEAEGLINNLDNTPQGFGIPTALKFGGVGMSAQGRANTRNLERFAGTAAIQSAASLKPLSNSDMAFLMAQQAGSGENRATNETFLRARQWADTKLAAKNASQDAWIKKLGSPNAMNGRGQSFETWWGSVENQIAPRPQAGQRGSYTSPYGNRPAQRSAPARNRAPASANGGQRRKRFNPATGNIE